MNTVEWLLHLHFITQMCCGKQLTVQDISRKPHSFEEISINVGTQSRIPVVKNCSGGHLCLFNWCSSLMCWKNNQTSNGDDHCSQVKILCSSYSPLKITQEAKLTFPIYVTGFVQSVYRCWHCRRRISSGITFLSWRFTLDEYVDFQ